MRKKIFTGLLTVALSISALTGCSDSGSKNETTSASTTASNTTAEDKTTEQTTVAESQTTTQAQTSEAEQTTEQVTEQTTVQEIEQGSIKIAASATPHAEILEFVKPILAEQGIDIQITVFDDYVQPNLVVEADEFDANYMEHVPYLNSFNEEQGTHLVSVGGIHYEPFGIYPGTKETLDELEEGDVIAIPNDTTNEARALLLLQDNGLLTLKEDAGLTATINDIVENPRGIQFEELEAAQVARVKDEVAFVVLNGNYALEAGLSVGQDAVAYEASDSTAAKTYVNIIVVKEGNEENPAIKKLVEVLKSDEVKQFIADKYDGAVIAFED